MKSIRRVIDSSAIPERLIRNVIHQLGGTDDLMDIANYGANSGFSGFTNYKDTLAFFKKNKKEIVGLVESYSNEFGVTPIEFVEKFNWLSSENNLDAIELRSSIARCLYGTMIGNQDDYTANMLSWFALEEVAHAFTG